MPSTPSPPPRLRGAAVTQPQTQVTEILTWLEAQGTARDRQGMARFGITSRRVFGVSMQTMRPLARRLGRNHELAAALWATGWHEARILASMVEEPARVTPRQMESWARDFDNWAVCDSVCSQLFDRTPYAMAKVQAWSSRKAEFVKRGAFAMIAGLAVHDRRRPDRDFLQLLPIIDRASTDERNFVMKAVNWALRQIGKRNAALNVRATALAAELRTRESRAARWVGHDAYRELTSPAVQTRLRVRASAERARVR
jgi:3-methyladenine DNA glycosylase AlkD